VSPMLSDSKLARMADMLEPLVLRATKLWCYGYWDHGAPVD